MAEKSFKGELSGGWQLLKDSFYFIVKKPIFLLPIFLLWIVDAVGVLYFRYWWEPPTQINLIFLTIFLFILLLSYFISLANVLMLEFIQQIESAEKISLAKAVTETLKNSWKILFISFLWAVMWFILLVIEVLTSRKRESERPKPSLRDVAKTLAGVNSPLSWLDLGLALIGKLVRMTIFLSLPAIAWESKGPISSLKKSFQIIKTHFTHLLSVYSLTLVATFIIVLPLAFIFTLDEGGVEIPNVLWTIVIIYIGIAWSLQIYLEQMTVGILYLWHLKWEKSGGKGSLSSVPKPDLLDNISEFKEIKKITGV